MSFSRGSLDFLHRSARISDLLVSKPFRESCRLMEDIRRGQHMDLADRKNWRLVLTTTTSTSKIDLPRKSGMITETISFMIPFPIKYISIMNPFTIKYDR
jgi:hypothetical protein